MHGFKGPVNTFTEIARCKMHCEKKLFSFLNAIKECFRGWNPFWAGEVFVVKKIDLHMTNELRYNKVA